MKTRTFHNLCEHTPGDIIENLQKFCRVISYTVTDIDPNGLTCNMTVNYEDIEK